MKSIHFFILVLSRLLKRYFSKVLLYTKSLILFLILILLVGISVKIISKSYSRAYVSEGIVGVYTKSNLPTLVTNLISEPLVILDQSGRPQPQIATSWKADNDSKLYTFKLKDNLFWSDGTKIKSSDIKFNLPDVTISYPDNQTIEFKLVNSFTPFPTFLTFPVLKNDHLIGLGKYKVIHEESDHNFISKLILAPVDGSNKDLPNIIIYFFQDENTANTAFQLGRVDSLIGLPENGTFDNQPSVGIKKFTAFNKIVAVFYNTKDSVLSDKNMRRALGYASPKIEGEERAKTSIPSRFWAYNNFVREFLDDPTQAKTSLDKVSFGKDSTITLTTTPGLSSIGEKIIDAWKKAGINAILRVESGIPQNFQALLISQAIPQDPDQYALWHSTQTKTNIAKYSSARIDKDLEDGRKISDPEARKEKYFDFQKIILDDSPATFLYFPKTQVIYRQKIISNLNKILGLQI